MKYHIIFLLLLFSNRSINAVCSFCDIEKNRGIWKIESIELDINIIEVPGRMKGNASIFLVPCGSVKDDISFILNRELKVSSVHLSNGEAVTFKHENENLIVQVGKRIIRNNSVELSVEYEGQFTATVPELDFHFGSIGQDLSYALCISHWYPALKGSIRQSKGKITYHVPAKWIVASSGKVKKEYTSGVEKIYEFEISSPVEFGFAAAPFKHISKSIEGIEMGVFLLDGNIKKAQYYLDKCSEIVRFMKEYYGVFPYESYSLIELPKKFLGKTGGGSYEGLTIHPPSEFPEDQFFIPSFAHEIGHLWWGSYIESPDGPIISEGLTQVSMGLYLEQVFGTKVFRDILKNGAIELHLIHSAKLYFHSIVSSASEEQPLLGLLMKGEDLKMGVNLPDKFQTLHTLANSKGSFVWFMLRDQIGKEAFKRGLRSAVADFAWRDDFSLKDLRGEFEKAYGKNLKWFFDQWFYRIGAPEFILDYGIKNDERKYRINGQIRQVGEVYRVNCEVFALKGERAEKLNIGLKSRNQSFSFLLPFKPDTLIFDPEYRILRWADEFRLKE